MNKTVPIDPVEWSALRMISEAACLFVDAMRAEARIELASEVAGPFERLEIAVIALRAAAQFPAASREEILPREAT